MIDNEFSGQWFWSPNGRDQKMYIEFRFNATEDNPLECDFYEIDMSKGKTDGTVTSSSQNNDFSCAWSAEEATQQIKVTVSCAAGANQCGSEFDKVWDANSQG